MFFKWTVLKYFLISSGNMNNSCPVLFFFLLFEKDVCPSDFFNKYCSVKDGLKLGRNKDFDLLDILKNCV